MAALLIDNEIYIKTGDKSYFKVDLPENTLAWDYCCLSSGVEIYVATINKITSEYIEIDNNNDGIISLMTQYNWDIMVACIFYDRIEILTKKNKVVYNFNFLEPMRNHRYFCTKFMYICQISNVVTDLQLYITTNNRQYKFGCNEINVENIEFKECDNIHWEKNNKYIYNSKYDIDNYCINCDGIVVVIDDPNFVVSLVEDIISYNLLKYDGTYAIIFNNKIYKLGPNEVPYILTKPATNTKSARN